MTQIEWSYRPRGQQAGRGHLTANEHEEIMESASVWASHMNRRVYLYQPKWGLLATTEVCYYFNATSLGIHEY